MNKNPDQIIALGLGVAVILYDDKCIVERINDRDCLRNLEIIPPINKWTELDGIYYEIGKSIVDHLFQKDLKAAT